MSDPSHSSNEYVRRLTTKPEASLSFRRSKWRRCHEHLRYCVGAAQEEEADQGIPCALMNCEKSMRFS
ncbi:hypothetical protein MLD38_016234 [Melastoma candidum]|uniref:Uncharacterized protein n=1 Tax=Melastoma candidum TaxID=119954 RepID=A0ACB9RIX7_9MYRT|nr:hypothetical protein MLD38_016234 [Melastoma candidum]